MPLLLQAFLRRVALPQVAVMLLLGLLGAMPIWSQNSGLNLSGSQNSLQTWNELYDQGQRIYEKQNDTLGSLNREISTLKIGYSELMNLSAALSLSNESLKTYNEQIAERMQERDEDLFRAYEEIDAKELTIAKKNVTIAKRTTHIIILYVVLGLVIIGGIAIALVKGYIKMKLPIRL